MPFKANAARRHHIPKQKHGLRVKHVNLFDFVLEHPDGMLVYGLDLRRDICREIRRFRPERAMPRAAAGSSIGRPRFRASRFPVPSGIMPSGRSVPATTTPPLASYSTASPSTASRG